MLQVHVEREHVPAEQVLAVRRVEPEGLDLALCLHTNISKLPASSGGGDERRRKGKGRGKHELAKPNSSGFSGLLNQRELRPWA
jgi:hypothetical protein